MLKAKDESLDANSVEIGYDQDAFTQLRGARAGFWLKIASLHLCNDFGHLSDSISTTPFSRKA